MRRVASQLFSYPSIIPKSPFPPILLPTVQQQYSTAQYPSLLPSFPILPLSSAVCLSQTRTDGRTTVPVDSSFVLSMDFPERTIYSKVTGPWTMSGIGKRFWSSQYCIQYSTVQYNGIYSIDCEVVVAMKR
ncbi:hypothetical protein EYC84_003533 [Monilinia fructicola]|uniref:Uncharacterized protein n=1 Tax=Monilinia fructicola TaxID=38448 RepID=A0A5M9JXV4_MONFR|nr:hypothetical protein EYC84_003533 [Monilinia fructicola]